jgi:hypothetical protein
MPASKIALAIFGTFIFNPTFFQPVPVAPAPRRRPLGCQQRKISGRDAAATNATLLTRVLIGQIEPSIEN